MAMQLKNVERKDEQQLHQIRVRAKQIRSGEIEV